MNFIRNLFEDIENLNFKSIGGKALCLNQLYKNNFPIPNDFVITTTAFDYFLKSQINDYYNILSQIKSSVDCLEHNLSIIQQKIITAKIPSDLRNAILDSFVSLNKQVVAVRSSAIFEDSSKQSFAGQLESFLGVTKENLFSKIKSCWSSLFSPRVAVYSKEKKDLGKIAVIVQEMIDADVSGVCFSINPVTGNPNSIIIEAIFGLGELLVQGAVVPDHYVVNKRTLSIENKKINSQEKKLGLNIASGGTKIYSVGNDSVRTQKLGSDNIRKIVDIVLKVEKFYNKSVDIEWALKDNKLYLLQGRPITTIK